MSKWESRGWFAFLGGLVAWAGAKYIQQGDDAAWLLVALGAFIAAWGWAMRNYMDKRFGGTE